MSDYATEAEESLERVKDVDEEGTQQVNYLFVRALMYALLDVADAIRSDRAKG